MKYSFDLHYLAYLKHHYGWADGRVVSRAHYYTKTLQKGRSGLLRPSQAPRWLPILQLPTLFASFKFESDQTPSERFQHSWAHRTDLFLNSSESPQTFQTFKHLGHCVPALRNQTGDRESNPHIPCPAGEQSENLKRMDLHLPCKSTQYVCAVIQYYIIAAAGRSLLPWLGGTPIPPKEHYGGVVRGLSTAVWSLRQLVPASTMLTIL